MGSVILSALNHRRNGDHALGLPEGGAGRNLAHRMLGRKPRMLVAITLANKMARSIWAMLTKEEDYRGPVAATL